MNDRQDKVPETRSGKGLRIARRMAVFLLLAALIGATLNHVAASLDRS